MSFGWVGVMSLGWGLMGLIGDVFSVGKSGWVMS